jgi:hypothetical protein
MPKGSGIGIPSTVFSGIEASSPFISASFVEDFGREDTIHVFSGMEASSPSPSSSFLGRRALNLFF